MRIQIQRPCHIAFASALFLVVAGCSTPGRSSATKATGGIAALQTRLTTGEQQMNATVASLVDLTNNPQPDVKPQYKKYLDNVGKLEAQIKKGRGERADMRSQAEAYFAKWEQDIQTLQNEEIKKVAIARRDAMMASFQKINSEFDKAKPTFQLFMNNLKEIQKALDFDLTPGGITAIKPVVAKVQTQATDVKKNIATVRAELDRVASEMAATAPSSQ
jgi:DNA repair exonuclease SbcCD ATPase subunit